MISNPKTASRIDMWSVLVLTSWIALIAWSILFLPRLERLYDAFETLAMPVWSSWAITAAGHCVVATPFPLWFLWSNPQSSRRILCAAPLVVIPMAIILGTFVPWLQLHDLLE